MIRVRTVDGKAYKMSPTARFVEICDEEGKVAAVVFQNDNGAVRVISVEDKEFHRYAKSYGLKPATVIDHISK
jgi:hypothetical protein